MNMTHYILTSPALSAFPLILVPTVVAVAVACAVTVSAFPHHIIGR